MVHHNFELLQKHILSLSESDVFEIAVKEWKFISFELSEEFDRCPCGVYVKEHFYIRNVINNNTTHLSTICINRYMNISTWTLLEGLKRIQANIYANANVELTEYAYQKKIISLQEYIFLKNSVRKSKFTASQLLIKDDINKRILHEILIKKRECLK